MLVDLQRKIEIVDQDDTESERKGDTVKKMKKVGRIIS